jgi:type I restriction enzyme R subunit
MDILAALATEKEAAMKAATDSGLSMRAFSVYWSLKDDGKLKAANISALEFAREVETLTSKFPNAAVNDDEQRVLRANLYKPLLALGREDRTRLVDLIIATLFR